MNTGTAIILSDFRITDLVGTSSLILLVIVAILRGSLVARSADLVLPHLGDLGETGEKQGQPEPRETGRNREKQGRETGEKQGQPEPGHYFDGIPRRRST